MTAVTKITAKGQTTVPQEIRALLDIKPGDLIAWEPTAGGCVRVRRVQPLDMEYLRAVEDSLSEWASAIDEDAYREL
jgi:antitoxin PrlF